MQFELEQPVLLDAVRAAARLVSVRSVIPVLSGVLLEARGQELRLRATDLEAEIRLAVPAKVHTEGEVVLPARFLQELLRRLPPSMLAVRVSPENCIARITWEEAEYLVHGWPADQFPAPDSPGAEAVAVTLRPTDLSALLRETGFATGHDGSRPWFSGVFLSLRGSRVVAMATDGSIIAYSEAPVHNPGDRAFSVILPSRSLQELSRLLPDADFCRLIAEQSRFRFDLGPVTLATRLLEGQYADFRKYLPTAYPACVQLDRERFQAACERAALAAHQNAIRLEAVPGGLKISSRTPELGEVAERLSARCEGEPFTVPLNVQYVLNGLRSMVGPDLLLEFAGPRTAVRFRAGQHACSYFAVLPLLSF